jgi:tetratricopeptide (TPR) repeat protein
VRLGDRYWDFEGARPFAYEYYASALVFAENDHARSRTGLTPAGLERLRARAAKADFTELELLATEPLVALANPDPEARVEELEALREEQIPASVAASLDRVLAHPEHKDERLALAPGTTGGEEHELHGAGVDSGILGTTGDDTGGTTGAPVEAGDDAEPESKGGSSDPPRSRRDPTTARRLVSQAAAADEIGNRQQAEALYNRALEADPRNVDALDGLASIAFRRSRYAESAKRLERAVKLGPRKASRWRLLGDAYFKTLRYSDARKAYRRALDLGDPEAAGRLKKLESKLGAPGGG